MKYLRGQVFNEWDEEWVKWIGPIEDYNPGAGVAAIGVFEGPTSTVAEGLFIEPNQELSPEESLVPRGLPAPDIYEVLVNGCSRRSHHHWGECQDGSLASSVDSTLVRSSWWDTSSESNPQTDSAGFSYTSFRR